MKLLKNIPLLIFLLLLNCTADISSKYENETAYYSDLSIVSNDFENNVAFLEETFSKFELNFIKYGPSVDYPASGLQSRTYHISDASSQTILQLSQGTKTLHIKILRSRNSDYIEQFSQRKKAIEELSSYLKKSSLFD